MSARDSSASARLAGRNPFDSQAGDDPPPPPLRETVLLEGEAVLPLPGDGVDRARETTIEEPDADDDWPADAERRGAAPATTSDEGRIQEGDLVERLADGVSFRVRGGLRLRVERLLGRGGMGVVYLVRDLTLKRLAALKLIRDQRQRKGRIKRFQREARITARLNHPSIPPVNEAGVTSAGFLYLLMRFVDGEPMQAQLERLWQEGRPPPTPAQLRPLLQAMVRVGEAVGYAHAQGIVHRDLKPDNIMIGAFGEVYVMDWGLARNQKESAKADEPLRDAFARDVRSASAESQLTRDGAVLGTPGFMAPEQARGEDIDHRVDIFSLGAILCELLTGHSPFGEFSLEILENTLKGIVRPPGELGADLPPELDAIATRALAPRREDRYPDTQAFVQDLRAYLEGQRVSVYEYRRLELALRAVRRHPTLTVSALAASLLLTVLTAFGWVRAAEEDAQQARIAGHNAAGEAVLVADAPDEQGLRAAQEHFQRALGLDPRNPRALLGERSAQAALARLRREQEAERARELAAIGLAALEAGRLDEARRQLIQATAFDPPPREALEALQRVERLLGQRAVERREAATAERLGELAATHTEAGRAHLERGEYAEAYLELAKATGFGSVDAEPLLERVQQGLLERQLEALREEYRARARELVKLGDEQLASGRYDVAERSFVQALGFDAASESAQDGLRRVIRLQGERERERAAARRRARARELLAAARQRMAAGQAAYRERRPTLEVLQRYFDALDLLTEAGVHDPAMEAVGAARRRLGEELGAILLEEGQSALSAFVLDLCDAELAADYRRTLPSDPYLEVREGDVVRIRQALGDTVRFAPTAAFDALRDYLAEQAPRFHVSVVIRSEAVPAVPHAKVALRSLQVALTDKRDKTLRQLGMVPVSGQHLRPITRDKLGPVVGAFELARDRRRLDAVRVVDDVRRLVLQALPRQASERRWEGE